MKFVITRATLKFLQQKQSGLSGEEVKIFDERKFNSICCGNILIEFITLIVNGRANTFVVGRKNCPSISIIHFYCYSSWDELWTSAIISDCVSYIRGIIWYSPKYKLSSLLTPPFLSQIWWTALVQGHWWKIFSCVFRL